MEGDPGRQLRKTDFLRLIDGTRIAVTGALAPATTLDRFTGFLSALDTVYM